MAENAKVQIAGEFSANELEEIIIELAKVRSGMEPAVPPTPEADLDREVLVQDDPLFTVRTLAGGGLRIWLRNEGTGWQAFQLSEDQRKRLAEFLNQPPGHTFTKH